MEKYNHKKIEEKWQKIWARQAELYAARDDSNKPEFYCLDMFPYPSGAGLHAGHVESYTATDIMSRYMRLRGRNVLHPQGWDAFGLPAENYAVKTKIHPAITTSQAVVTFKKQMNMMGFSYDWSRELNSSEASYYKWTQWFFLLFYKNGLAYKKKAKVNWCDSCQTVLANEQAEGGACDRCGSQVAQKDMEQWFFKITDFLENKNGTSGLLAGLDKVDWPESTKTAQKNWIGKSEGAIFKLAISPAGARKAKYEKILLATNNISKKDRVEELLRSLEIATKVLLPEDLGIKVIESEEAGGLLDNAREKAKLYRDKTDLPILSFDTGFFIQGETINPIKVKRNALKGQDEKKLTQLEISRLVLEYYKNIACKRGGKVEACFQDELALSLANGTVETVGDKREVILTDQVKGKVDIYFPTRSLYMAKATGKYTADENEQEKLKELWPFAQSLRKLLGQSEFLEVFTTRLDTVFGITYAVLAPEHKLVAELKDKIKNWPEVEKYLEQAKKKTDLERMETKEKTGVEIKGVKAVNPFNGEELPLFVADYVLAHYGTGAIMAVPAHDERDWEFAKKYDLPIKQSIASYHLASGNHPDAVRENEKTVERNLVYAIVKHWNEDKYLCLDWKNQKNWTSMVVGGVENDEILLEAGRREILEETGYKNFKFIKEIELSEIHSYFYARHKNENRYAKAKGVYVELLNGEKDEIVESEKDIHAVVWVTKDKIKEFLAFSNWKLLWDIFLGKVKATVEDGILVNSGEYSGLKSQEAREKMTAWLEKENLGSRQINYKIRDWLVSRQRYWGAPIPIIYCAKCGAVPVPEKDLPVKLPTDVDFMPTGKSPLVKSKSFHNVKCPVCGNNAKRESDTMDTFVCSSWYYFRYADVHNKKEFAGQKMLKKWLPVDLYVGGAEHTVLHLLYARFFTKVLHNLGYIDFDEPFLKLRHQGIILAEDGRKMSKSLGNVVNPDEVVKRHGADALRLFEMFMGPLEDMKPWNTKGIIGQTRFLEKIWNLFHGKKFMDCGGGCEGVPDGLPQLLHKTIKKVGVDIENLRFNTAISQLMIFINFASKAKAMPRAAAEKFLVLLSPFAPHLAEELWSELGHEQSIFKEKWPEYSPEMVKDETINLVIQINGRVRDAIKVLSEISEEEAKRLALENEKIKKWLKGQEVMKIIFVKGRLVNIVVKG